MRFVCVAEEGCCSSRRQAGSMSMMAERSAGDTGAGSTARQGTRCKHHPTSKPSLLLRIAWRVPGEQSTMGYNVKYIHYETTYRQAAGELLVTEHSTDHLRSPVCASARLPSTAVRIKLVSNHDSSSAVITHPATQSSSHQTNCALTNPAAQFHMPPP